MVTQLNTTPLPVHGAIDQLQRVFINIFNNAMDAMPSGGQLTVTSTRWETGTGLEHFVIEVRDTGYGMPENVLAHIFEPFFTTKPRGSRTGLGLVVARQIINSNIGET
ncbi:MAG: sensor histidine kinase [Acidobacteriota bacterium]